MGLFGIRSPIYKRKVHFKQLCRCVLILVVVIIFIVIFRFGSKETIVYDSFQEFSYPMEYNFHEILNSQDVRNLTKLINYEPRLINNIRLKNDTGIDFLVIVKSAIGHLSNRDEVRQTWATNVCQKVHNFNIYFALGYGDDKDADILINMESETYEDILRFNFVDTYENNTYKVMAILDHFANFHSSVRYLLIIDDDFFLNPSVLADTITNRITRFEYMQYVGGYVWFHNSPIRNRLSKWFISKNEYSYDFYPPYAVGGFLLISNPMVKVCNKLLPFLKYLPWDDVMLGILLFKLNIYPHHLTSVSHKRTYNWSDGLLASHQEAGYLIKFWKQRSSLKIC